RRPRDPRSPHRRHAPHGPSTPRGGPRMVAPTITIDGRQIAPYLIRSGPHTGIANLRIEWGRESIFDAPQVGNASFSVITRGIDTPPPARGQEVRISHPEAGVVFRGTIVEAASFTDYITHANGYREKITETRVTAHDAVASLAQLVPMGPARTGDTDTPFSSDGGWKRQYPDERTRDIMDAGAGRLVVLQQGPYGTVQSDPPVYAYMAEQDADDSSALELLHQAYSMVRPLATLTYRPRDNGLYMAALNEPASSTITLREPVTS